MALTNNNHPFEYHAPTPEQTDLIKSVRRECKLLYDTIIANVPESRERSLAITKLEEVSMWVNKAIVMHLK